MCGASGEGQHHTRDQRIAHTSCKTYGVIRHFPTKPGITPPPPPSTPHLRHHQGGGGGEGRREVWVHFQLYPRKRGGLIHPTFSLYISLSLYPHTHPLLQGCDLTPSTFLGGARGGSAHLPISPIVKPHRPPLQFGRGGGERGGDEGRLGRGGGRDGGLDEYR